MVEVDRGEAEKQGLTAVTDKDLYQSTDQKEATTVCDCPVDRTHQGCALRAKPKTSLNTFFRVIVVHMPV